MSKKILILNGSPRKKGNTSALVKAFTEGAESAGGTVTEFFLNGMDIHDCKGCFGGGKDPEHPCVQRDDMEKIYPVYKEADVVVLASPLYYWTISGQLKCAFDRLFAVAECDPDYRNPKKECVLLMAAEGNGFEERAMRSWRKPASWVAPSGDRPSGFSIKRRVGTDGPEPPCPLFLTKQLSTPPRSRHRWRTP